MKIQIQNQAYFPRHWGGAQTIMARLARELREKDHEVSILCRADDGAAEHGTWDGVPVVRHPHREASGKKWVFGPVMGYRNVRKHLPALSASADVLWPLQEDYALADAQILKGMPVLYIVQHNTATMRRRVWQADHGRRMTIPTRVVLKQFAWIQRKALECAKVVVTWCHITKLDMVTSFGIEEEKIHVVPLGPGLVNGGQPDSGSSLRESLHIPTSGRVVLCACRLVKNKNVGMLIRALAKVQRRDVYLVIAGDGPDRGTLAGLGRELGLEDRIRFVGVQGNMTSYYAMADVFVFPSVFEGFGMVLVEAMSMGLPCIGLKADYPHVVTASEEIIVDGVTGYCVSPYSDAMLAEKIEWLASDMELARAMGARGRERCREVFSWEKHVQALLELSRRIQPRLSAASFPST